jgi:hypothetical protein
VLAIGELTVATPVTLSKEPVAEDIDPDTSAKTLLPFPIDGKGDGVGLFGVCG